MIDKTHYIAVTGIIKNTDGKYLICKRSEKEKVFLGKWCVPGGKIEMKDLSESPKDIGDYWLGVFEKVLHREIAEETGLKIKNIGYVSNLAFIRPNGYSTIIVSLHGEHADGEVTLKEDELTDFRWVSLEEAREFDLLENLWEQMRRVDDKSY